MFSVFYKALFSVLCFPFTIFSYRLFHKSFSPFARIVIKMTPIRRPQVFFHFCIFEWLIFNLCFQVACGRLSQTFFSHTLIFSDKPTSYRIALQLTSLSLSGAKRFHLYMCSCKFWQKCIKKRILYAIAMHVGLQGPRLNLRNYSRHGSIQDPLWRRNLRTLCKHRAVFSDSWAFSCLYQTSCECWYCFLYRSVKYITSLIAVALYLLSFTRWRHLRQENTSIAQLFQY